jgi:septal ring factor EnvC (AmiA/AmiB activator)
VRGLAVIDIPDQLFGAAVSVIVALFIVLAMWAVRTVRRADRVVNADADLRQTVSDQRDCISALETKVRTLTDSLAAADRRIADLERIIGDMQTVERLRPARRERAVR